EMVYTFNDKTDSLAIAKTEGDWFKAINQTQSNPPYRGHVNEKVARDVFHDNRGIAPLFADGNAIFQIATNRYMAMGDNTMNIVVSRRRRDFSSKARISGSFICAGRYSSACFLAKCRPIKIPINPK